jgi:hypothetical protein
MSKTKNSKIKKSEIRAAALSNYVIQPWSCNHQPGKSQIAAYNKEIGQRVIIAETCETPGLTAEGMAEFIIASINSLEKRENLIDQMESALEICLECGGLNWAAEHDAEIVLRRARNRV